MEEVEGKNKILLKVEDSRFYENDKKLREKIEEIRELINSVMFSIVQTCLLRNISPRKFLTYLFCAFGK